MDLIRRFMTFLFAGNPLKGFSYSIRNGRDMRGIYLWPLRIAAFIFETWPPFPTLSLSSAKGLTKHSQGW